MAMIPPSRSSWCQIGARLSKKKTQRFRECLAAAALRHRADRGIDHLRSSSAVASPRQAGYGKNNKGGDNRMKFAYALVAGFLGLAATNTLAQNAPTIVTPDKIEFR